MGNDFYKNILNSLGVNVVVRNNDRTDIYNNLEQQELNLDNLELVTNDVYIDNKTRRQYHKIKNAVGDYIVESYYDITKFLRKELSIDKTDENVVVRDENGNIVYSNFSNELLDNLKQIDGDTYFEASSNCYFQKNVTVCGRYSAETYHDVTKFIKNINKYTFDGLTGLPTRHKINEYLKTISTSGDDYIIAMIDIDNFKNVNDTYGHLVGDEVLKRVATVVKDNIRGEDFAGRYGGEEFILIFKSNNFPAFMTRLDYIRILINQQSFKADGFNDFNVSVSIGVSGFNSRENNVVDIINQADKALYYVKQHGKNAVSRYKLENDKINEGINVK